MLNLWKILVLPTLFAHSYGTHPRYLKYNSSYLLKEILFVVPTLTASLTWSNGKALMIPEVTIHMET